MERIADFLSGKTILITGGTGFVTKGLVEKLVRTAPGLRRVVLLIREQSRASGETLTATYRLRREVIGSRVFDRLRRERQSAFEAEIVSKLEAVPFDLTRHRLGLDDATYARLAAEVDIVISVAASVNFDERLDRALEVNTLGPRRVVRFARDCKDAVYLQVSTAYVGGCQTGRIPETELPRDRTLAQMVNGGSSGDGPFDIDAEIESIQDLSRKTETESRSDAVTAELTEQLSRQNKGKRVTQHRLTHQMDALRSRWVNAQMVTEGRRRARQMGWHDSYTLTKAMGEQLVGACRGDLPAAIVRPSIIESSLEDPEAGWLDGLKVADPLIAHFGKGRLSDFPGDPNVTLDVIPVDIVVNAVIAALPRIRPSDDITVYHVATGDRNPMKVGEVFQLVYEYFKKNPMQTRDGVPIPVHRWRFPGLKQFQRKLRLRYGAPLSLLSGLIDRTSFLPWSARFRRSLSIQQATLQRVLSLSEIYSPYTHLDCTFDTSNTRRLHETMHPEDRDLFNLDVTRINWAHYIQNVHIPGLKRFVLKSDDGFPPNASGPSAPATATDSVPLKQVPGNQLSGG